MILKEPRVLLNSSILILLVLISPSHSTFFPIGDATTQYCFSVNLTNNVHAFGMNDGPFYSVMDLTLPVNGTFWDNNLVGYFPAQQKQLAVYVYYKNSTHVKMFMPIVAGITPGVLTNYCVFSGSSINNQSIRLVAPYNMGASKPSELGLFAIINTSAYNITDNNGIQINTPGTFRIQPTYVPDFPADFGVPGTIPKGLVIEAQITYNYPVFPPVNATFEMQVDRSGGGLPSQFGVKNNKTSMFFNGYSGSSIQNISIVRQSATYKLTSNVNSTTASLLYGSIYYNNYTAKNSSGYFTFTNIGFSGFYAVGGSSPILVTNANVTYNWFIIYRGLGCSYGAGSCSAFTTNVDPVWSILNQNFTTVNKNITILQPSDGSTFDYGSNIYTTVQYKSNFDNCSVYVNNENIANYSTVTAGFISTDLVNTSTLNLGDNNVLVQCFLNGTMSQRFSQFAGIGGNGADLFNSTFGFDPTLTCASSIITQIAGCNEAYKLQTIYNFSAVVCPNLNLSYNYACLSVVSNKTHNNYTIFYSPASWVYPTADDVQHVGAVFYANGNTLDGKIEIYANNRFVYLPAQTKDRDCDIFYTTNASCSWGYGFVLNRGQVAVSDIRNNWFVAGGLGIPDFTTNYSQIVVPTNAIPLVEQTVPGLYPNGIYNRINCVVKNNTFDIIISATKLRVFTISTFGDLNNNTFTVNTETLETNISTINTSLITVTDGENTICNYNSGQFLFLPFGISGLGLGSFSIITKVMFIFVAAASAMNPYIIIMAIMLNDAYHLLNVYEMALIVVFAIIAALVNNTFILEKTLKHVVIMLGIFVGYISWTATIDSQYTPFITITSNLNNLLGSGNLFDFAYNSLTFLAAFGNLVLTLPFTILRVIYLGLYAVSPPVANIFVFFGVSLALAATGYILLRIVEILTPGRFLKI